MNLDQIHTALRAFLPCTADCLWLDLEFLRKQGSKWPELPESRPKLDAAVAELAARGWIKRDGGELVWCPKPVVELEPERMLFS